MGRIIAYSGSHGTGKTTAVLALLLALKKKYPIDPGMIKEVARDCPLPVLNAMGGHPCRAAQRWIFAEQMKREIEAANRHRVTVADRTLVDNIAYSAALGYHDLARAEIEVARTHCKGLYERVIFRGMADNPYLKTDGFRATDAGFAKEVEDSMLEIYGELDIPLVRDRGREPLLDDPEFWVGLKWIGVD